MEIKKYEVGQSTHYPISDHRLSHVHKIIAGVIKANWLSKRGTVSIVEFGQIW